MTTSLFYTGVYLLALVPGLPLGFALFGRRHAAGWVAGGLYGYVLTALAIWAPIQLGVPSALTFAVGWSVAGALAWFFARGIAVPLVALPRWSSRDTRALAAVWLLTLVIAVPPLARAGAAGPGGDRYYRAYFTADFVWHAALASEVSKFASPPRNPYLANRPIHYYWTYFLLPGGVSGIAPGAVAGVDTYLKVNAVGSALLFVSAMFICAWAVLPRAWPVAAGVALAIVASSAEGAFALWRFWRRGVPLGEVRNLNIDALANWWPPHGLRIDGLQRCFWWVPQHSMAYALGLVALAVVNAAGSAAPAGAIALAGFALAGSAMMNPFVGGIFSLVWGGAVVIDAARSGDFVRRILRHSLASVPVVLALAWCAGNQMVEGGGSALQFGRLGEARNTTPANLMLSLGPAFVAALVGVFVLILPPNRLRQGFGGQEGGSYRLEARAPIAALLLSALSIGLLYFVRLNVDTSWVGFRAGQMFLVAIPALIARGFIAPGFSRRIAIATAALALIAGAPTTMIDAYNAQDVTNFSESPIGPWTVTITRDEHEGLEWLRTNTPAAAIVQMEPLVRARQTWSLIPSFAQRRMAAGQPISLLGGTTPGTEYAEKAERVRTMYQTENVRQASEIARSLRIDYVWVDRVERTAYPSGAAKFEAAPQLFVPAFRNAEVSIYHVR
jgi:hypothetical protein